MDLRSSDSRASWHPLTSLILMFDSAAADRPFYGAPFLVEDLPVDDEPDPPGPKHAPATSAGPRSAISTIHHELTHLFCARTTRLGWALGVAGAKVLSDWRAKRPIIISPEIDILIGAYTPILEGLALYTELDFQANESETIISNPVVLHASLVEVDRRNMETTLKLAREQAIAEDEFIKGSGLLRRLFLDTTPPAFYLAGYLWIKAVSALISRRCPALAPPARMLPLLVRMLCDHPVISQVLKGHCDAAALIAAIHDSVIGMSSAQLHGIASMIDNIPDAVKWFDRWDIHAQIASCQFKSLIRTQASELAEYLKPVSGAISTGDLEISRAAASVHLLSVTRGTVLGISDDRLELGIGPNQSQSVHLLSIEGLWRLFMSGSEPSDKEKILGLLPSATQLEYDFCDTLRKSVGHEVTLANYMCLIDPVSFGLVLWQSWSSELPRRFLFPLDWYAYDASLEAPLQETLTAGTWLSPQERRAIGNAVNVSEGLFAARARATETLFGLLISNVKQRGVVATQRFGSLRGQASRDFEDWVRVPIIRRGPRIFGSQAAAILKEIVDLPEFKLAGLDPPLAFVDLLPVIRD